jgi:carboxymethylenebutenolidase
MTSISFLKHSCILTLVVIAFFSHSMCASSKWVEYKSGNDTLRAYLAVPDGKGPFPALVVIHEWWGLNDWVKANADEFARQGYIALAIDLYRGNSAQSPEEAHELMRGLPEDRAVKDLKAAVEYLESSSAVIKSRVGSIGWCMGGGYSLATALNVKTLAVAVVCYGRLVTEPEEIRKISCPVLGIFGEDDKGIPASSVREFEKASKSQGKDVTAVIYPGAGHAFMNQNNKAGYHQKEAEDAWTRIRLFLDSHLKAVKKD